MVVWMTLIGLSTPHSLPELTTTGKLFSAAACNPARLTTPSRSRTRDTARVSPQGCTPNAKAQGSTTAALKTLSILMMFIKVSGRVVLRGH